MANLKFLQHHKHYYSQKQPIFTRKFENTRSTKALRDYFALPESQPTPATLLTNTYSYKWIISYKLNPTSFSEDFSGCMKTALVWLLILSTQICDNNVPQYIPRDHFNIMHFPAAGEILRTTDVCKPTLLCVYIFFKEYTWDKLVKV